MALICISKALAINTDRQTKDILTSAKTKLDDLKRQIDIRTQTNSKSKITNRNPPVNANKSDETGGIGVIVGIIFLGIIIFVITNANKSSSSNNNNSSGSSYGQPSVVDSTATVAKDTVTAIVDSAATVVVDSTATVAVDSTITKADPPILTSSNTRL